MYDPSDKLILVVDNSKTTRDQVGAFLEDLGYHVLLAEDGHQGVGIAQKEKPDLIIMDLKMPVLDGVEASARIRKHSELSDVPILAISSSGRKGIELFSYCEKMGEGYVGYLTKPINLGALAEEITLVLSRTHGRDADPDHLMAA